MLINKKFINKILKRQTPESFLPHSLPFNFLLSLIDDNRQSRTLRMHSASILFCNKFKITHSEFIKDGIDSPLFSTFYKNYLKILKVEYYRRCGIISAPIYTEDDILTGNLGNIDISKLIKELKL